jgi:hypothetical protein
MNSTENNEFWIYLTHLKKEKPTGDKRYSKCGFLSCAQEAAALSCVFVETFEIFIYICAGRQLSNNLIPHLP